MQAKKMIDDLPHDCVKKAIFKKGLVNILPGKISNALKNNIDTQVKSSKSVFISEVVSNSGSTKSDELAKLHHKDELLSINESEEGSANRFTIAEPSLIGVEPEFSKTMSGMRLVKDNKDLQVGNSKFTIINDDDVSPNLVQSQKPVQYNIEIEEEKVESMPKQQKQSIEKIQKTAEEVRLNAKISANVKNLEIVPIKSSSKFHKKDNNKGYDDFLKMINVRTRVIDSNRKDIVGNTRPIFSEKQLGLISNIAKAEVLGSPQIKSLVQTNRIREEDIFWDNFWLFKQKEEEKRIKKDNDEDSDEEHKVPMKLGDYLKNPQILIQIIMKKNLKKLKRNLIFINSIGGLSLMSLLFIIQLRYSYRFRKYSKILIHFSLFAFTIVGFGASVAMLYKGLQARLKRKKTEKIEDSEKYDIKNEELPELRSETLFKKKLY